MAWVLGEGIENPMLWMDIGTGKSLVALYAHQLWGTERLLIVSPNSVLRSWAEQIEEHTNQSYCILQGEAGDRKRLLAKTTPDIFVLNYEGLLVLFAKRIPDLSPRTKRKTKHVLDWWAVNASLFDGIVFDEIHNLKNVDAIQTQIAQELSSLARHTIGMTGSPVSRSEADVFAEYWVLNGGLSLGTNYHRFLDTHFDIRRIGPRGRSWSIMSLDESGRKVILDRIAPVTMRYSREECLDLPDKTYQVRYAKMTSEQRGLIDTIIKSEEPLQQANKLAQIAGGFLIRGKETIRLKKSPKLDEFKALAKEVSGKAIVWHQYVEEGRMIGEALGDMDLGFAAMRGEIKDKDSEYKRFREDENCRWLVAHPKSAGQGLNLQHCAVEVFYSNGWDGAIERDQAEGRIYRAGQGRPCVFIDLCLRDSIDEAKMVTMHERANMAQTVMSYVANWGGIGR